MINQGAVTKGILEGIGILLILFVAKNIDKSLFSIATTKSGIVLVSAATLSNLGIEYLEEKGYFSST